MKPPAKRPDAPQRGTNPPTAGPSGASGNPPLRGRPMAERRLMARLCTPRTVIRLARERDVDAVLAYWRDHGDRYQPPLPKRLLKAGYWRERFEANARDLTARRAFFPYVFDAAEARVIGTVQLTRIAGLPLSSCCLGYCIAKSHEGAGYMSEAVRAVIDFAFDGLGLHRIEAFHAPENQRSARLLERLGFQSEGVRRQHFYCDGVWADSHVTSLLNPRWTPPA